MPGCDDYNCWSSAGSSESTGTPSSGWATDWDPSYSRTEQLSEEEVRQLQGLSYSDAHCHLDICLLNAKMGKEMWNLKKFLCDEWKEGWCNKGEDCEYAHGQEDRFMRSPLDMVDVGNFAYSHDMGPRIPGVKGICNTCGAALESRRCIVVNGVEFCSIEHIRAASGEPAAPSEPMQPSSTSAGPRLECMIHICCEEESINDTLMLVLAGERVLGNGLFCTFGCHPHNYEDYDDALEAKLLRALRQCGQKAVGWGECGLDYYKNFYHLDNPKKRPRMLDVFARQARLAAGLKLPLVVHSRDAEEDTMAVLRGALLPEHKVHLHAFQGSVNMMQQVLESFPNSIIGISGVIAFKFKTPSVVELVKHCPLDRLVLESDAPFLAEDPLEIPRIARAVAMIRGITTEEVLSVTSRNCQRFYNVLGHAGAA